MERLRSFGAVVPGSEVPPIRGHEHPCAIDPTMRELFAEERQRRIEEEQEAAQVAQPAPTKRARKGKARAR